MTAGSRGCQLSQEVSDELNATLPLSRDGRNALDLPSWHFHREGGPLNVATVTRQTTSTTSLERAVLCARTAANLKARDIVVLDMREVTPLYDFFVLATGTGRRQIHTLAEEMDAAMREVGDHRLSIAGYEASRWVVQDYGDVVVHVFDPDTRTYYALEDLWADASRVDWEHL